MDKGQDQAESSWLASLGPGIVTGAADDDPSGIATYSHAAAQFGYGVTWTLLFNHPLMVDVQLASARIGRVSGHGMATNIRRHYPPWLLYAMVFLLLSANTICRRWERHCAFSSAAARTSMPHCSARSVPGCRC